jgi:hypothetical protein
MKIEVRRLYSREGDYVFYISIQDDVISVQSNYLNLDRRTYGIDNMQCFALSLELIHALIDMISEKTDIFFDEALSQPYVAHAN